MIVALRIALAILLPVVSHLTHAGTGLTVLLAVSAISSSVYYTLFTSNHRASSFQILTMVLLLAVVLLGWARGLGSPGALQLSLALLFSPLLSVKAGSLKRLIAISPFWFFTGWAVGEIFSTRYGDWGYLLSVLVLPIVWRDFRGEKVQKAQ